VVQDLGVGAHRKRFSISTTFTSAHNETQWSKSTGLVFASENIVQVNFTIPKATPSGTYLLRVEQIALHTAQTYQGAQFVLLIMYRRSRLTTIRAGSIL
jgi:hypothetical protein